MNNRPAASNYININHFLESDSTTVQRTIPMPNDKNFNCKVVIDNLDLIKLTNLNKLNMQSLVLPNTRLLSTSSSTRRCTFTFNDTFRLSNVISSPQSIKQTTASPSAQCKVCKRSFKGRRGLNIHLGRNADCKRNASIPTPTTAKDDDKTPDTTLPKTVENVVKSPSTTVESLEQMCGNGLNTKIKKHNSKHGCKLCHHLSTKDHFVSTSTHRVYQAVIPPNIGHLDCNSSNVIYLITCKKCRLQYVGETAQKLRKRRNHHDSCFHHPEKDNYCRILSDHFSKGLCKNATYSVHIIEKLEGSGRDENGEVDPSFTTIRRKKETEWMLKLRTVFPYGLNDRVGDEYMTDKNNTTIATKFPTLKRTHNRHRVRTKIHTSSDIITDHFLYIVNESFRRNLRNTMNLIRVLLSSLKKSNCKILYGRISDYLADKHDSFLYVQYFQAALDIISSKLGKPPIQPLIEKKPPSNRCHIVFDNKAIDFINVQKILRDKEVLKSLPVHLRNDTPMVVYELTNSIHSKLFNYKKFVQSFDVDSFLVDNTILPCECEQSPFINHDHNHIITGNLDIINDSKLRHLVAKGPKYREPGQFSHEKAKLEIMKGIDNCIKSWSNKIGLSLEVFKDWKDKINLKIDDRISTLALNNRKHFPVLKDRNAKKCLSELQEKYVIVPIDKASNNVAFICKRFYASKLCEELGMTGPVSSTYTQVNRPIEEVIKQHCSKLKEHFNLTTDDNMQTLPDIYWTPKLHKNPVKFRFIIASKYCTLKHLSKNISSIFSLFNKQIETYNRKAHYYSGVKPYWIISNRDPVLKTVRKSVPRKSAKSVSSFDFSTLYTKIPHDKLFDVLYKIIDFAFKGGTNDKLAINAQGTAYWVGKGSKARQVYTKESIKHAVTFLITNCYFKLGNKLFRQDIGIPMGSDPAPFFANLFLYYYESSWLRKIQKSNNTLARKFGNVFRFIDDLLALNDGLSFESYHREIYPEELELTKENSCQSETDFLDLHITIDEGVFKTKLYDKRDYFGFTITRLPYKDSNIPSRMFYSSIAAECLRISRSTSSVEQTVLTISSLFSRMYQQGAEKSKMKNAVSKAFNKHQIGNKFNISTYELLNRLFA